MIGEDLPLPLFEDWPNQINLRDHEGKYNFQMPNVAIPETKCNNDDNYAIIESLKQTFDFEPAERLFILP